MNATRKKKISAPAETVSSASVASVKQQAIKASVAQETVNSVPQAELACKKIKFIKPAK